MEQTVPSANTARCIPFNYFEELREIELRSTAAPTPTPAAVPCYASGGPERQICSPPSATSVTSARTHEPCDMNEGVKQRRLLVPMLPGAAGIRIAATAAAAATAPHVNAAGSASEVQLRDTATNLLRSYPLYHDAELGLEELGSAMDAEMAAVPVNCREDDDVQTTSEVLALGVETVERYLSALLLLPTSQVERQIERRVAALRSRLLRP